MPDVRGNVRAAAGPFKASTDVQVAWAGLGIGLVVVAAVLVLTWAAEGTEPRNLYWINRFTELESAAQDFHTHLATAAEVNGPPVRVPTLYPDRTAPGITETMHEGWSQQWRPVADLPSPSREPW